MSSPRRPGKGSSIDRAHARTGWPAAHIVLQSQAAKPCKRSTRGSISEYAIYYRLYPVCRCADWADAQRRAAERTRSVHSTSSTQAGGSAASILSQLGLRGNDLTEAGPQKSASKLVPVGAGLPSIPKKLVEQIQAGQYVDFGELPPAKGRTRPLPSQEEGHIVVVRAEDLTGTRKLIPDLATWLQCFAIYMAVSADKEPDRTSNLLAYMVTIAKTSVKYSWPSWVVYDQNFRQEAADNGLKDWSKVEPNIYTQCFTNAAVSSEKWCNNCQSIDHSSNNCPLQLYHNKAAVAAVAIVAVAAVAVAFFPANDP